LRQSILSDEPGAPHIRRLCAQRGDTGAKTTAPV
jgi:hypothetical protein